MMKTYSVEKNEWREKFTRGDSFRSSEIYQCKICHTKTNRIVLGGYPGWGVRILCPGDKYEEHLDLEYLIQEKKQKKTTIKSYTFIREWGVSGYSRHINELEEEKSVLETAINDFRKVFAEFDDLEHVCESAAKVVDYTPYARHMVRKKLEKK